MSRIKYPIGIQSFEKLRTDTYIYIDKTATIYDMVASGKYYFLNRPRRFGKSLLISTLEAYFQGKKELFEGLAIAGMEREWRQYPVLHFDFSGMKYDVIEDFKKSIGYKLSTYEKEFNIDTTADIPFADRLVRMVMSLYKQTGMPVVILIDEYDAPMLFHLGDDEKQQAVRQITRSLFSPIKMLDPYLKFVMFTGIIKFSQLSVFSELNNLENISLIPKYDSICGISEEELVTLMREDIEKCAKEWNLTYEGAFAKLKEMFNGYHFSENMTDMYNPFSLLNTFKNQKMQSYWFASGTPTFLIKVLQRFEKTLPELENLKLRSDSFDVPVERIEDPIPVLVQSGYLTIKSYDSARDQYTIGFPNKEVRTGFATSLAKYIAPQYNEERNNLLDAYLDFRDDNDLSAFIEAIKTFFAGYTYELNNRNERHYHALLYTLLVAFGADVRPEVATSKGKADIVLCMPATIYVTEIKLDHSAQEALNQIDRNGYALPYLKDGREVVKLGINFSSETRNISEWKTEVMSYA